MASANALSPSNNPDRLMRTAAALSGQLLWRDGKLNVRHRLLTTFPIGQAKEEHRDQKQQPPEICNRVAAAAIRIGTAEFHIERMGLADFQEPGGD